MMGEYACISTVVLPQMKMGGRQHGRWEGDNMEDGNRQLTAN